MFWAAPYNLSFINARCERKFKTQPRVDWISTYHGGHAGVAAASNIVYSNGLLDPWSSGGVTKQNSSVLIALGAHHLDLMFSTPDDPPCVKAARKTELATIREWIS